MMTVLTIQKEFEDGGEYVVDSTNNAGLDNVKGCLDDHEVALELQKEFDRLKLEEEAKNLAVALKLQEEIQEEGEAYEAQTQSDLLLSRLLQDQEKIELSERKRLEEEDLKHALALQQQEKAEHAENYARDSCLARELHYKQRTNYSTIVKQEKDTLTSIKDSVKFNDLKGRNLASSQHEVENQSKRITAEELLQDIMQKPCRYRATEIRMMSNGSNLTPLEQTTLKKLAPRAAVYYNNEILRQGLQTIHSGDEWGNRKGSDLPTLDLHELLVQEANHRIYGFLDLAQRYKWGQVGLCVGSGSHTGTRLHKSGHPLFTMTDAVLSKLASEPIYSKRKVSYYNFEHSVFTVKVLLH